ncbi:hypothetical protein [Kitasatospora sp. NPDC017646]|uniref:hypothetical protein n=1 Tax=Kitasatospora sp. NPDC017646 TaxID=3364024 RepID=UPI0037B60566
MRKNLRRWVIAIAGAVTAAALGSTAVAATDPAPADSTPPPPAVEDFTYPLDSPYPVLKLLRGDGHIMLADCHTVTQIQIWSRALPQSTGEQICFRVSGATGYLALQLPETTIIQTADRSVQASLTTDGATTPVSIPKNTMQNVGEALGLKPTTLVELRITG